MIILYSPGKRSPSVSGGARLGGITLKEGGNELTSEEFSQLSSDSLYKIWAAQGVIEKIPEKEPVVNTLDVEEDADLYSGEQ